MGDRKGEVQDSLIRITEGPVSYTHLDVYKRQIQVPELYVGLVHSCAGDDRWPGSETGEPFSCPPDFENQGGLIWDERFVFEVPDVELKKRMLQEHRTALKPDAVKFLNAFIRKEEVFWKIDWQRPEQESNNLEE